VRSGGNEIYLFQAGAHWCFDNPHMQVLGGRLLELAEFFLGTKFNEDGTSLSSHRVPGGHLVDFSCMHHFFMSGVAHNHASREQVSPMRAWTPIIREACEKLRVIEMRSIRFVSNAHVTSLGLSPDCDFGGNLGLELR
jgi:hypothetical protein